MASTESVYCFCRLEGESMMTSGKVAAEISNIRWNKTPPFANSQEQLAPWD